MIWKSICFIKLDFVYNVSVDLSYRWRFRYSTYLSVKALDLKLVKTLKYVMKLDLDLVYIWKNWHLCLFLLFTEICYWQRYQTGRREKIEKINCHIGFALNSMFLGLLGAILANLRYWKLWIINQFQNNLLNKERQFPIKGQFQVWK